MAAVSRATGPSATHYLEPFEIAINPYLVGFQPGACGVFHLRA